MRTFTTPRRPSGWSALLWVAIAVLAFAQAGLPTRVAAQALPESESVERDPNVSRLFFGPTGRTVSAGSGYAGLFELFFPFLTYGLTDQITLSGGTPVVPGLIGEAFYLSPKVRLVSVPNLDLAAGVIALFATREIDEGSVGIVYGVGTSGTEDQSVTFGAGWGFAGSSLADRPVLMLGGEHRIGRRSKLISENYFVPGLSGGVVSGGVRVFGAQLSGDVGLGAAIGSGGGCCLPLLNFVYHFGGGEN